MGHLFPLLMIGLGIAIVWALTRALRTLALTAAVVLVAATAGMWFINTETVQLAWRAEPSVAQPGDLVTVSHGAVCNPNLLVLYRAQPLHRWQRTHIGEHLDIRNFWDLEPVTYEVEPGCTPPVDGSFSFRLPETVKSGRVAICNVQEQCAELTVEIPEIARPE